MNRRAASAPALPACLLTVAVLSGCAAFGDEAESSDPRPVHSPAATLDPGEAAEVGSRNPGSDASPTEAPTIVDPGWDAAAMEAEDVFLSLHEGSSALEFRAVDSTGEMLWTATRPRVCSGFLVVGSSTGPVAVLMDQQASSAGDSLETTASGFALSTGKQLWGPVEVPGPLLGSGLVFAGPPQEFIGQGGPRLALDPATGDRLAVEDEDSPRVVALLGEHLIRADGDTLFAEDLKGTRLWSRRASELGVSTDEVREMPWEAVGDTHALIGRAGRGERTLLDLRTGATVAAGIDDAGYDARSSTLVTSDSSLHGFDLDGSQRWEASLPGDAELAAVGNDFVVTEAGNEAGTGAGAEADSDGGDGDPGDDTGEVIERSATDGKVIESPTGLSGVRDFGAPHLISESGAQLVGDPTSPLLIPAGNRAGASAN